MEEEVWEGEEVGLRKVTTNSWYIGRLMWKEQWISQYVGRAGDLVMSTRAQHDCGGMNDGKTGLWACFAVPGLPARRFGGIICEQDIDYRWLKRVSDFCMTGLIFCYVPVNCILTSLLTSLQTSLQTSLLTSLLTSALPWLKN